MEKKLLQNIGFAAIAVGLMATSVSADKYADCAESVGKSAGEKAGAAITSTLQECKGSGVKSQECLTNAANKVTAAAEVSKVTTAMKNCMGK